jgi:hypothetical protein
MKYIPTLLEGMISILISCRYRSSSLNFEGFLLEPSGPAKNKNSSKSGLNYSLDSNEFLSKFQRARYDITPKIGSLIK